MTGMFLYNRLGNSFLKVFVWLLGIIALNETLILYYSSVYFYRNLLYNLFSLLDMSFFFFLFYSINEKKGIRSVIVAVFILLYVATFFELFVDGWMTFHVNSLRLYNVCMILLCCYYFFMLFRKDYYEISTDPLFYLCFGVFVYQSILFVNFTTISYSRYWKLADARKYFKLIQNTANICYYTLICVSLIISFYNQRRVAAQDSYQK